MKKRIQLLEGFTEDFVGHLIPIVLFETTILVLSLIFMVLSIKLQNPKIDKHLTRKMREITGNNDIIVKKLITTDVNAYNAGGKTLYYTSNLVAQTKITEDELISILIHEYSHYINKDVWVRIGICVPCTVLLTTLVVTLFKLHKSSEDYYKIIFTGSFSIGALINMFLGTFVSRKMEYRADNEATKYGYENHMIGALSKLKVYMAKVICPEYGLDPDSNTCKFLLNGESVLDDHPSIRNRIKNIKDSIKKIKELVGLIKIRIHHIMTTKPKEFNTEEVVENTSYQLMSENLSQGYSQLKKPQPNQIVLNNLELQKQNIDKRIQMYKDNVKQKSKKVKLNRPQTINTMNK